MNALTRHQSPDAWPVASQRQIAPDNTPIHDAVALTAGGHLARIHLEGQVYSLRITRQGKLILTK